MRSMYLAYVRVYMGKCIDCMRETYIIHVQVSQTTRDVAHDRYCMHITISWQIRYLQESLDFTQRVTFSKMGGKKQ